MRMFPVLAALAVLWPALPAAAADPAPGELEEKQRQAREMALEGAQKLMQALQLLIESLPQYGSPRIDENGNIVIPRLPPPTDKPGGEAQPAPPETPPDEGAESGTPL